MNKPQPGEIWLTTDGKHFHVRSEDGGVISGFFDYEGNSYMDCKPVRAFVRQIGSDIPPQPASEHPAAETAPEPDSALRALEARVEALELYISRCKSSSRASENIRSSRLNNIRERLADLEEAMEELVENVEDLDIAVELLSKDAQEAQ